MHEKAGFRSTSRARRILAQATDLGSLRASMRADAVPIHPAAAMAAAATMIIATHPARAHSSAAASPPHPPAA